MVTVAELQALRQARLDLLTGKRVCLSRKMVAELNIRRLLWMSLTGRSMMRSRYWGQPGVAVVRWE
ncbi:putative DNA packaging protein of prophage [Escherichia coli PA31]|nr:putative DNA packaging protein of prophage [Escherichia coli PA31]